MAPASVAYPNSSLLFTWLWLYWVCAVFHRIFSSVFTNSGRRASLCVASMGFSVQSKCISCVSVRDTPYSAQAWGMK